MTDNGDTRHDVPVFDGKEYSRWRFRVKLQIEAKGWSKALDEAIPPETDPNKREEWKRFDVKARNEIVKYLSNNIIDTIAECKTANEIIEKLDKQYRTQSVLMALLCERKLLRLQMQDDEDPQTFFHRFDTALNELKSATEDPIPETRKLNYLLLCLPEKYNGFIDALDLSSDDKKNIETVKAQLMMNYRRRDDSDSGVSEVSSSVFKVQRKDSRMSNNSDRHSAGEYNKDTRPMNNGDNVSFFRDNRESNRQWDSRDRGNYGSARNDNRRETRTCNRCGKVGHIKRFCRVPEDKLPKTEASSSVAYVENDRDHLSFYVAREDKAAVYTSAVDGEITWIIDSGATDHIITTDIFFTKSIKLKNTKVKVGDGNPLKAVSIGSVNLRFENNRTVTIDNVFYVPEMENNCLSVSQLTSQKFRTAAQDDVYDILDSDNKILGTGKKVNRLYYLKTWTVDVNKSVEENCRVNSSQKMSKLEIWHRILAHSDFHKLKIMSEKGMIDDLPKFDEENEKLVCEICALNKFASKKFNKDGRRRASDILEIIHTDVCGPIKQTGYKGQRYFVTFIDDYSRYADVYIIKSKDQVFDCFVEYVNVMMNLTGKKVKKVRCDNGREYLNRRFYKFAREKGFRIRPGPPRTSQLNGVAERYNRTIMNRARCLRAEAKMPKQYWPEAVKTAAGLGNRLLTNTMEEDKTPYEIIHKRKPSAKFLMLYGSRVYLKNSQIKKGDKMEERGLKGILVGYTGTGYRVLVNDEIITTRHVEIVKPDEKVICSEHIPSEDEETLNDDETPSEENQQPIRSEEVTELESETHSRPKRERRLPDRFRDYVVYVNYMNANSPENYDEAMLSENAVQWEAAMEKEMESILKNNTYDLVDKPIGKQVIRNRWVFTQKLDGSFKARLVALGYQQTENFDESNYSPVARMTTLKSLLSICCREGLIIQQFDVATAFLNGTVKSEIYMVQPKGFDDGSKRVCRLKKALYGLRESPRCWFECFDKFICEIGFCQSMYDVCLYIYKKGEDVAYLLLYVDDLLICSKNDKLIGYFHKCLQSKFEVKDLGPINIYLGVQIIYDREKRSMCLSQKSYIESLAKKFKIENCRNVKTPMETNLQLEDNTEVNKENTKYRSLIGALLYISGATRPDVSFSVSYLSRFQSCATETHYNYALRVLKYLFYTREMSLKFSASCILPIQTFVDADWAGDTTDRRSVSGMVIYVYGNPVMWVSRKQKCVTRSSCFAEYYALANAVEETVYVTKIIGELGVSLDTPALVKSDSSSAINLGRNGNFCKRSKHVDVALRFVKEYVDNDLIKIKKVDTDENVADVFTKSLSHIKFFCFRDMLNIN